MMDSVVRLRLNRILWTCFKLLNGGVGETRESGPERPNLATTRSCNNSTGDAIEGQRRYTEGYCERLEFGSLYNDGFETGSGETAMEVYFCSSHTLSSSLHKTHVRHWADNLSSHFPLPRSSFLVPSPSLGSSHTFTRKPTANAVVLFIIIIFTNREHEGD